MLLDTFFQMEAGQLKLRSRLEEEEQAKAALLGRIQRLTKLILVSTKNTVPQSLTERVGNRRRHSFGEDEVTSFSFSVLLHVMILFDILKMCNRSNFGELKCSLHIYRIKSVMACTKVSIFEIWNSLYMGRVLTLFQMAF